jgi:penicillin-binding protein 1A
VYAEALGRGFSPVSVLRGLSAAAPAGREEWVPRNVHLDAADATTLRAALRESNNRAAAALQQRIGAAPVIRLAARLGMPGQPDVPSLALGTGLVSPFDLTLAYAVFPNGGLRVGARSIVSVTNAEGEAVLEQPVVQDRVLTEAVAYQMVSMLEDVVARGTGAGARQAGVAFPIAGKTGTTDEFKDAWFVGFSSSVVAGVWVGFDQPSSIGEDAFGGRLAAPIWSEFMRRSAAALPAPGRFEPPAGMRPVTLCRESSLQPVDGCPTYVEYLKDGDEAPSALCSVHEGSVQQRVDRAVGGLLGTIGRALKGLFRKR